MGGIEKQLGNCANRFLAVQHMNWAGHCITCPKKFQVDTVVNEIKITEEVFTHMYLNRTTDSEWKFHG